MRLRCRLRRQFCFMPAPPASEQSERLQKMPRAAHRLKPIAHSPRPIATAQMSHQAARPTCASHVSRLTSDRLTSSGANGTKKEPQEMQLHSPRPLCAVFPDYSSHSPGCFSIYEITSSATSSMKSGKSAEQIAHK